MQPEKKIRDRLAELVEVGDRVLGTGRSPPSGDIGGDRVDGALVTQWATSAKSVLDRAFGPSSTHSQNFAEWTKGYVSYSSALRAAAVLRAALDDWEGGHVFELRALVEADVFDDFLEQAEHLHANGYFQAAAVIAGAVLEDAVRRACTHHGVPVGVTTKLDRMNADLAKAGIYSKLVQKKITTLADLRNKAAHGDWASFDAEDVSEMLTGVRGVLGDLAV
jgi:hypothetical protein